jgi:demethylphylloquinone reductase
MKQRIVVAGGGFGGLFCTLGLEGPAEITLISQQDHFLFTPLLYEYLSGEVEAWHIAPSYRELLDDRVRIIKGEITGVDIREKKVLLSEVQPLEYDVLVLALGGITSFANVEGAEEHALPFRLLAHADAIRARMIERLDQIPPDTPPQKVRQAATFAIVGAGASGVELSTKISDMLRTAFQERGLSGEARIMLLEMNDTVVPEMNEQMRSYVEGALRDSHIEVHTRTRVVKVTADGLVYEHAGERTEEKATVIWTGGVQVSPVLKEIDLPKDRRGILIVEPTLQVKGHEEIFSVGDIAKYSGESPQLAGTAQLAFQQSALAAENIRAYLKGQRLKTRTFVEIGEAVSLGTENAVLMAGDRLFSGQLARQARFAMYTTRLPTWQHRLKVSASWFFEGRAPESLSR